MILAGSQAVLFAQEKKDSVTEIPSRLSLLYLNTSNDTVVLTANLSISKDDGPFALENAWIGFTATAGDEIRDLGKIKTNGQGDAVLKISIRSGIPADKEGKTLYTAKFNGQGKYPAASENTSAKPARINVTFAKEDSLRFIKVSATEGAAEGQSSPIRKEKVIVYIPRLFNLMKIGEIALDEKGEGQINCPDDLVGDSLGNIVVVARIEENDTYGNVQGQSSITWGIPKQYYLAERPSRELRIIGSFGRRPA